jgi:hypothetical protein
MTYQIVIRRNALLASNIVLIQATENTFLSIPSYLQELLVSSVNQQLQALAHYQEPSLSANLNEVQPVHTRAKSITFLRTF